jgi:hypothetical protein
MEDFAFYPGLRLLCSLARGYPDATPDGVSEWAIHARRPRAKNGEGRIRISFRRRVGRYGGQAHRLLHYKGRTIAEKRVFLVITKKDFFGV